MEHQAGSRENAGRNNFLAAATTAIIAFALLAIPFAPLAAQSPPGQAPADQSSATVGERPQFDAVSIKRSASADPRGGLQFQRGGRIVATNIPLRPIFALAYNISLSQGRGAIIGAPSWFDSMRYDIEAKAEGDPPREQMILMLQSLLADRFKLAVHHETRQLPVYALVLTKAGRTGPHLKPHASDAECINEPQTDPGPGQALTAYCGDFRIGAAAGGGLRETADAITMDRFAASIAQQVDRPVVDRTGLDGVFDLDLQFTSQRAALAQNGSDAATSGPEAPPPIFTAIQEQLGLKLESTTGPVDVLVIDHVEEPSEN